MAMLVARGLTARATAVKEAARLASRRERSEGSSEIRSVQRQQQDTEESRDARVRRAKKCERNESVEQTVGVIGHVVCRCPQPAALIGPCGPPCTKSHTFGVTGEQLTTTSAAQLHLCHSRSPEQPGWTVDGGSRRSERGTGEDMVLSWSYQPQRHLSCLHRCISVHAPFNVCKQRQHMSKPPILSSTVFLRDDQCQASRASGGSPARYVSFPDTKNASAVTQVPLF